MDAQRFPHLPLRRLIPENARRSKGGGPRITVPEDPAQHAATLQTQLAERRRLSVPEEAGFDPRLLLKLQIEGLEPSDLEAIPGLRVVSQERKSVVVLFATDAGLTEFQARLDQFTRGLEPTRKDIIYAVKGIEGWTAEDRTGASLRSEGTPDTDTFTVDVELWPLERGDERQAMRNTFATWCRTHDLAIYDSVNQETVIMFRVQASADTLDALKRLRDVRVIDLPPRYQVDVHLRTVSIGDIAPPPGPRQDAAGLAILDTGVNSNHPLLASAIGDAQTYVQNSTPADDNGHGTLVAGHSLYHDVLRCARARRFVPQIWLYSGKILDEQGEYDRRFIENQVVDAVTYFQDNYGCRVFNLSLGDKLRVYTGSHPDRFAAVLDTLSRERGVLFVVSTGNFEGSPTHPRDWRQDYPEYLFNDAARLLDPAPAVNALTVGSLAGSERSASAQRNPEDPAYQAVARRLQPSPFTRTGPGPGDCIKPEVVEIGGNYAVDTRAGGRPDARHVGELSLSANFARGNLLAMDSGTSFAAPRVAHIAARILNVYPDSKPDLLRALIAAHATIPNETAAIIRSRERQLRVAGYGLPDLDAAIYSLENRATLVTEESIGENLHHFYEIPLPPDFLIQPVKRPRRIRVALAHTPMVRRTRVEYKLSNLSYRVVRRRTVEEVVAVFKKTPKAARETLIKEAGDFFPGTQARSRGTLQASTWNLKQVMEANWRDQRLFIVVTRQVPDWALNRVEVEAYALVVVIEDLSTTQVRFYSQIQHMSRAQMRV